jgi:two-component system KDP operon response regulator KdpE
VTQALYRVLVIEDDVGIATILSILFETNGFRVATVENCEAGIRRAQTLRPDVCVLDLGLPDRDGLRFIEEIRTWSAVPIIVLTARAQEDQRLAAFEAGVDDYVTKPFSCPELLARVKAVTRRMARSEHVGARIKLGEVVVDLATRTIRRAGGGDVRLTPLEHRILECLVRRADGVVTHAQLLKEVWGPHRSDIRALRVYVASLRRKLEPVPTQPRYLLTESGIGYRLVPDQHGWELSVTDSAS